MDVADLDELVLMQERGAVAGLSNVFPQDRFPFPRATIRTRWNAELQDPGISAYVATIPGGDIVGFAARAGNEVLHFGTAPETWASGLAGWMHDALISTFPPDVPDLRLRVFVDNGRARRFYEKLGWTATDSRTRTPYPPYAILLEYVFQRSDRGVQRGAPKP